MAHTERRVYDNGLVAISNTCKSRQKSELLIGIKSGSGEDSDGKEGTAHLLEHMLFKPEISAKMGSVYRKAEFNGIRIMGGTNPAQTIYEFKGFTRNFPLILKLARDMMEYQDYTQEQLEKERDGVVRTELAMVQRNPLSKFKSTILNPILFRGTKLGRPVLGSADSLQSISLEDLSSFRRRFYVPNNMVIVGVGGFESEKFFKEIDRVYGKLKPCALYEQKISLDMPVGEHFFEMPELKDSRDKRLDLGFVYVGFKVNSCSSRDNLSLDLLRDHFTTGGSSEFFQRARLEKGIAYAKQSNYTSIDGENAVFYLGIPGVHPINIEVAKNILKEMVQNTTSNLMDILTLRGRKIQMALRHKEDSSFGNLNRNLFDYEMLKPYYEDSKYKGALKNLSRKEIMDVASRNFSQPVVVVASAPGYN